LQKSRQVTEPAARTKKRTPGDSREAIPWKKWRVEEVFAELRLMGTKKNVEGMAKFGIRAANAYRVSKSRLDVLAKRVGRNHGLGLRPRESGVHGARILAGMISRPEKVRAARMEQWVRGFDNWDTCDGTCCHLFVFAKPAWTKAFACTRRTSEFQKRAGFAMAAYLAYRDKSPGDAKFLNFLKIIEREADDERNFVCKAVNWALRNIGKRNLRLNTAAINAGERLRKRESRAARWVAADALRELRSEAVQERLRRKERE
jgi:3-methyladenine DNA glycosylase AlkD